MLKKTGVVSAVALVLGMSPASPANAQSGAECVAYAQHICSDNGAALGYDSRAACLRQETTNCNDGKPTPDPFAANVVKPFALKVGDA